MSLLIDENLSPRLAYLLQDIFPGSLHIEAAGLLSTEDDDIWDYAQRRDLIVVTKDRDYRQLSLELGHPPKVILIRTGNCRVREVESLIRNNLYLIRQFLRDEEQGLLSLL